MSWFNNLLGRKSDRAVNSENLGALSPEPGKGGFTFLHRVFTIYFEKHQPVLINVGNNYYSWSYQPGMVDFYDGVTLDTEKTMNFSPSHDENLRSVTKDFDIDRAFAEAGVDRELYDLQLTSATNTDS
jgi:hypothetical protein